jgi:hypothetical protein
MDLKSIKPAQRDALLDLLVLGMYADGHLARVEDARIERVLHAMGWTSKYERERELDASVTRVRKYADKPESVQAHAQTLAGVFSSKADRQQALNSLEDLLRSDKNVPTSESQFLDLIRKAFA